MQKIESKPQLELQVRELNQTIIEKEKQVSEKVGLILKKDQDISDDNNKLELLRRQKEENENKLRNYKKYYNYFNERTDIYEIDGYSGQVDHFIPGQSDHLKLTEQLRLSQHRVFGC